MTTTPVKITPPRLIWLQHLAKNGETAWRKMPKNNEGHTVSNTSWKPLVEAGLIEAKYYAPHFAKAMDHYFKITDVGRQVLAQHAQLLGHDNP